MAKKNVRDEPLKPQVSENEQMSDIVFILDKMELILQAVSKIGKDGKYSTVPADKEHSNSFLKIDRYANMFENFVKNFWSQLKDPTQFRHPLRQGGYAGQPGSEAGHQKTSPPESRQKPWKTSSKNTKSFHATRKTKVSTIKIKKKWQRKNETQQQAAQGDGTQQPKYRSTSP